MNEEKWTTAQIEAYLRNTLPEEEQAQLMAELQQDKLLRAEVDTYQRVLEGLDALQEQRFRNQLGRWKAEEALHDKTELITWYLNGQLAPDGQAIIETRIAEDPSFKADVEAYRDIIGGMAAVQDDAFRSQMQTWEADLPEASAPGNALKVVSRRPVWQYAAAAVGALLIALATLHLYVKVNYSGPALAGQYYQSPLSERTMGGEAPTARALQERIDLAHRQLAGRDYNAAFMAFDSLVRELPRTALDEFNKNLLLEQAAWNRLLAATGMDNPPIDVIAETRRISQSSGHEYQRQAKELLEKMETRWFQWAN